MQNETVKTPAEKKGARKLERRMSKLTEAALDSLEEMLSDSSLKPSDRLSAIKLAFDIAKSKAQEPGPEGGTVRVVFEGIPEEWAE